MRRLIINADDFGLTSGVNRGILECARSGTVTSVSLMATGGALADAVERLGGLAPQTGNSRPDIGCHLVLVDGIPILPAAEVRTLLGHATGTFRTSFIGFATAALSNRLHEDEITAEAEAQIRRVQSAGVHLSHIDTHKHTHMFPVVLRAVLQAARMCGIRAIRNPFSPVKPLAYAHLLHRPHLWKRYTQTRILRGWELVFRRAVADAGLATTDGTFGIVSTGALDWKLFAALMGSIPPGTWEFCCHPGYNDLDLGQITTRLRASRDREREIFCSAAARELIQRNEIELISFRELGQFI